MANGSRVNRPVGLFLLFFPLLSAKVPEFHRVSRGEVRDSDDKEKLVILIGIHLFCTRVIIVLITPIILIVKLLFD